MGAREEWRGIPGFEGRYEVSDHGRVRSLDRVLFNKKKRTTKIVPGRILKPIRTGNGGNYLQVKVGKPTNINVLVASAFIGPRPNGLECCHNDGNGHNNHLSNLRYDTHSENMKDVRRQGLGLGWRGMSAGEKNTQAVLTVPQVIYIKKMKGIKKQKELAIEIGVSPSTISHIHTGRKWSSVSAEVS